MALITGPLLVDLAPERLVNRHGTRERYEEDAGGEPILELWNSGAVGLRG